jgi:hypothetical protein
VLVTPKYSRWLDFTERDRAHDRPSHRPSQFSRGRERWQRQYDSRFLTQRAGCRIVQACLVRAMLPGSVHGEEARGSTSYSADSVSRSQRENFPLNIIITATIGIKRKHEPTSPFPLRAVSGRPHSSLVYSRMSRYVRLQTF